MWLANVFKAIEDHFWTAFLGFVALEALIATAVNKKQ